MKYLLIIVLFFSVTHDLRTSQKKPKSTCFYFCDSRSLSQEPITQKQIVLYTKVAEIADDLKNIKERTEQWKNFVDKICENGAGCTSDLNYYPSLEAANRELTKTEKFYSDTTRFILKKVNF